MRCCLIFGLNIFREVCVVKFVGRGLKGLSFEEGNTRNNEYSSLKQIAKVSGCNHCHEILNFIIQLQDSSLINIKLHRSPFDSSNTPWAESSRCDTTRILRENKRCATVKFWTLQLHIFRLLEGHREKLLLSILDFKKKIKNCKGRY